jgi:protocatechuate 3,4-dioxygenase beta subunit
MSTIKISELPKFSIINANTANTLFVGVDIPSAQTFHYTAGTLAAGLYANTALVVGSNNNLTITGNTFPQKGFIFTPRILQGAQTAITINFATDSMIRATFAATVTNTLSNYVAGKVVEMWLTNTAGNTQSLTHGCLANNSTTGTTSTSVSSGYTIYLKYFSVGSDQANTFVSVVKS